MPRNMSFMLTTEQVRNRTKTVTRRNGWAFLRPGDIVNAVEKGQGLKKGEKVKRICQVRILKTNEVWLDYITQEDVIAEGFLNLDPQGFIRMYCKANKCSPVHKVNRIEFEYV